MLRICFSQAISRYSGQTMSGMVHDRFMVDLLHIRAAGKGEGCKANQKVYFVRKIPPLKVNN